MLIDHSQLSELQHRLQIQCEYPGQALTVSLAILLRYPSLIDALEKGASGYSAAQCDNAIPGAGDAVSGALNVLKKGVEQDCSAESMVNHLNEHWRDLAGHQESYRKRVDPGLKKAKPFEAEFISRWDSWKAASLQVAV